MKHTKLPCVALTMWMAFPAFGAVVETVSESFVGSSVTVPGVQGAAERIGFFSLRTVRPAIYAGRVSSVGPTTIADAGANWTVSQFNGRAPLYAEFDNGVEADIEQVNAAGKTLSFSGALPPSLTAGTSYRIREHHTVAEVFGTANQSGLLSGLNSADAETIRHFIPQTQQTRTYFYVSFEGFNGWVAEDYSAASNVVIYPEQGLMLRRKTAQDLTLTSSGPLRRGASRIPIFPGYNLLGLYNSATPIRLDSLNLLAAGFQPGENADAGDNVLKFNTDGTTQTYFYLNLPGFEGWYDYGYQPAGQVTLSPGTVFMIFRRPPRPLLEWTMPAN